MRRAPKVIALTATRNEDWVLGLSLRVSLSYCDAVVITDHCSGDRSGQIIRDVQAEFPERRISVRRSEDEEWREMDVRQKCWTAAAGSGALTSSSWMPTRSPPETYSPTCGPSLSRPHAADMCRCR